MRGRLSARTYDGVSKTERAIEFLRSRAWAAQLVHLIDENGLQATQQGYRFEARFAHEMALACPKARIQYEYRAGVGDTRVDFCLELAGHRWLLELVSLEETATLRELFDASRQQVAPGIYREHAYLRSDAPELRETSFAEVIHVGERIEDKVWDKDRREPCKFPEPQPDQTHIVLVNMAGFEGTGDPDRDHCREIVFGSAYTRNWVSDPARPITGLFDLANTRRGAQEVRRRIHALAFVAERPECSDEDEIRRTLCLFGNQHLHPAGLPMPFPVVSTRDRRDPLYSLGG